MADPKPEPELVSLRTAPSLVAGLAAARDEFIAGVEANPVAAQIDQSWETAIRRHLSGPMGSEAALEARAVADVLGLDFDILPRPNLLQMAEEHLAGIVAYGELIEAAALLRVSEHTFERLQVAVNVGDD